MKYTMWTVQNEGDTTTGRKISRATGILYKSKLFYLLNLKKKTFKKTDTHKSHYT